MGYQYLHEFSCDSKADAVSSIQIAAASTYEYAGGTVLSGIGGFCSLVEKSSGIVEGSAQDGVGGKELVSALVRGGRRWIGFDLVAMNVNDLAVTGITPHTFLDEIAFSELPAGACMELVNGIAFACRYAGVALIGGETAVIPRLFPKGFYHLSGTAFGSATSRDSLITGERIEPWMRVYGLPSNGIHSSGFTLVRRVFGLEFDSPRARFQSEKALEKRYDELKGRMLAQDLIAPTFIYTGRIARDRKQCRIEGMAHVTGGGIPANLIRILPEGCCALIDVTSWKRQAIFGLIQKTGELSERTMLETFNCGLGLIAVSHDDMTVLGWTRIGNIVPGKRSVALE